MATSFHPSEIQYVSDTSIQLQSMRYDGVNPAFYQDSDIHDSYQNGNYGNGSSHPQPSSSAHHDVFVTEEEEDGPPPRTRIGPPKDFFKISVCIMILFCSPIGITAVQSSLECRRAIKRHNMTIADAKSDEAKLRSFLALLTGIASWLVIAAFIVLGVLS